MKKKNSNNFAQINLINCSNALIILLCLLTSFSSISSISIKQQSNEYSLDLSSNYQQNTTLKYSDIIQHRSPIICVPSFQIVEESPNTTEEDVTPSYNKSLIDSSTVYWLNSGGASVIPLHSWTNSSNLDKLLNTCNSVLIHDLGTITNIIENENKIYFNFINLIYNKVKEINDEGKYKLPIYAIGTGFDLIQVIEANSTKIFSQLKNNNIIESKAELIPLELLISDVRRIRMVRYFDGRDIQNLQLKNSTPHFGGNGVLPDAYMKIKSLKDMFKVIAIGKNGNNKISKDKFISMIEAYRYPIYGISFNPARYIFERNKESNNLDFSNEAITIAQKLLNFFIKEAFNNLYQKAEDGFFGNTDNLKFFKKKFYGINIFTTSQKKINNKDFKEGYYFVFRIKNKNKKLDKGDSVNSFLKEIPSLGIKLNTGLKKTNLNITSNYMNITNNYHLLNSTINNLNNTLTNQKSINITLSHFNNTLANQRISNTTNDYNNKNNSISLKASIVSKTRTYNNKKEDQIDENLFLPLKQIEFY